MPSLTAYLFTSGGAILLDITATGNSTLERSTDQVTWTTLYSNESNTEYLDTGDGLPGPLTDSAGYYYQLTDTTGTVTVGPYAPASGIYVAPDPLADNLVRLLRAALAQIALPSDVRAAQVVHALPLEGFPPLPIIVMNDEMEQQEDASTGLDVEDPDSESQTTQVLVGRFYRISALCNTVAERTFYKSFIATVLYTAMPVFSRLGLTASVRIQGNQTQLTQNQYRPGFYMTEVLLYCKTMWGGGYDTNYDLINSIDATFTANSESLTVEAH